MLREVTAAGAPFFPPHRRAVPGEGRDLHGHTRPDPVAVRPDADQPEPQRVAEGRPALVREQLRRAAVRGERQVEVAVPVVVEGGERPAHPRAGEVALAPRRPDEPPAPVAEQLPRLGEGQVRLDLGDVVQDVPVRHRQVHPAVVVEVGEVAAEGQFGEALGAEAEGGGGVEEQPASQVPVEGVRLEVEVGDDQVHPAVPVGIAPVGAHPCLRQPLLVVGDPGGEPGLPERHSRRPGLNPEEEVRRGVVRHIDLRGAVPREVGDDDAEPLPLLASGHRGGAEPAVAEVLEEGVRGAGVLLRMAVGEQVAHRAHAVPVAVEGEVEVVGRVDVQVAVPLGVEERGARRPPPVARPRGPRSLAEGPVAEVAVEALGAEVGQQQVGVPVVVEVPGHAAHAVAEVFGRVEEARFRGAVLEGPVAPVPVEAVPDGRPVPAPVSGQRPAVHEEEVRPAVLVVVEDQRPAPDDLHHVPASAPAVLVVEADPRLPGAVGEGEVLAPGGGIPGGGEEQERPEAGRGPQRRPEHRRTQRRRREALRERDRLPEAVSAGSVAAKRRSTASASAVRPRRRSAAPRL